MLQDLIYGWRWLRKNRGFTLLAVLMLAVGIGVNTAIFSLLHQVVLSKLPVPRFRASPPMVSWSMTINFG